VANPIPAVFKKDLTMWCLGGRDPWKKIRTSLVINSKNPVREWLVQALDTAKGFDEIVLYIDGAGKKDIESLDIEFGKNVVVLFDEKKRTLKEGYNFAASMAKGEWIVIFCDDDYFYPDEIDRLNNEIKDGKFDEFDVIVPKVMTIGGVWGSSSDFTLEQIKNNNLIPSSSFVRKEKFDMLGGYKVDSCGDWNLWIRAKAANLKFCFLNSVVYFFRQNHRVSFTDKSISELGFENIKRQVLENV